MQTISTRYRRLHADGTPEKNMESMAQAGDAEVAVGPICDPSQLLHHECGRGVTEGHLDSDLGKISLHAPFPRLSDMPSGARTSAPTFGEHNEERIARLGLDGMGDICLARAGLR